MRESIVVICPTTQGQMHAALWHDGQIKHGWHARVARRASWHSARCRHAPRMLTSANTTQAIRQENRDTPDAATQQFDGARFSRQARRKLGCVLLPLSHARDDAIGYRLRAGAVTAALASRVKRAIGIDIEPHAIERARRLAAQSDQTSMEFTEADMTALPFGDNAFDAVFAHGVLYHLDAATLAKTLGEARRVLRPGGVIGIRDSDTGGDILHPESKGLLKTLDLWMKWYGHADLDSVRFGRRQSAVLRTHGFTPVWSGASYVNHSADADARCETVADAQQSLNDLRRGLIARGLTNDDEIDEAIAAWGIWGRDPDAMYLRCRCECVARKG
jgi:SAM-dependent methyltransferase